MHSIDLDLSPVRAANCGSLVGAGATERGRTRLFLATEGGLTDLPLSLSMGLAGITHDARSGNAPLASVFMVLLGPQRE